MRELFQAAEENGIAIEYCRLPLNGSVSAPGEKGDFILMDYDLIDSGPSEWVHLAHELGHCVTGSFYNRYAALDVRRKHENRADKWAVKKLLTAEALDSGGAVRGTGHHRRGHGVAVAEVQYAAAGDGGGAERKG